MELAEPVDALGERGAYPGERGACLGEMGACLGEMGLVDRGP